ncbi:MAG: aminotransferase class V-fold PLP-dependent enzyme [Chloroflexi bacterium]|nr:aminotransferase class V-fold PLP-dependent enzyme [Chloroflexota bacterium]
MAVSMGNDVYDELGVRVVINAQGNRTVLGGSSPAGDVRAAMDTANRHYVEMEELLEKSGRFLADILGTESAYVTSGAGAALALSAAACIAGNDPDRIMLLPDTTGMRSEIVIQRTHRYSYDRCLTSTGGHLVEAGDDDGCTVEQLEEAIGPNTAAVAFLVKPDQHEHSLPIEDAVRLAHEKGVPVIADAAAQNYPAEVFRRNAQSADLVCFGAKYLGAPHSTGLVCGKKDLVDAIVDHGFIGFQTGGGRAIGRPMKVDRDGVIAVVTAVRNWFTMNHEDRLMAIEGKLSTIQQGLRGVPNVETDLAQVPLYWGFSLHLNLDSDALGKTAQAVAEELADGDPRIFVTADGDSTITVNAHALNDGEETIVAEHLRNALLG